MRSVPRVELKCEQCRGAFSRRALELARHKNSGRYCSIGCRGLAMRDRVKVDCRRCGKRFERAKAEARRHRSAFCSWACWKADTQDGAVSYPKSGQRHTHRILGEQIAGRPLLSSEVVHHKDENKRNNRLDNLEISTRADHSRTHNAGKIVSESTRARLRDAAKRRREVQQ